MTSLITEMLTSQMIAALETLGQCIHRSDEATWVAPHADTPVNQVVFHTLFYADLYLCGGPDTFQTQSFHRDHAGLFRENEEATDDAPAVTYDRSACVDYLAFCAQKARTVLDAETSETLAGPSGFHWLDFTRAELHVYNTRHIQHHAAQLGLRFQLAGGAPLKWVAKGSTG